MFQSVNRPEGSIEFVQQETTWLLQDQKGVLCFDTQPVVVPSRAWAEVIQSEWTGKKRDLLAVKADRPATQVAKLAILGTAVEPQQYVESLMRYLSTDTVFYWQQFPEDLYARQSAVWRPVLDWASTCFGSLPEVRFDLKPVVVSADVQQAVWQELCACDHYSLAVLIFLSGISGSIFLSLAQLQGVIDAQKAYEAACLEALYQREHWGADEEADARLERARGSFILASNMMHDFLSEPSGEKA